MYYVNPNLIDQVNPEHRYKYTNASLIYDKVRLNLFCHVI